MKKFAVIVTVVAVLFGSSAFAQGKMSVGVGVGYNLPQGDFAKKSELDRDAALGYGVNFGYMVNDKIQAGIGVGYAKFGGGFGADFTLMPIMVSGRYYFMNNGGFMPYGGVLVGLTNEKVEVGGSDESAMIFSYGVMVGTGYAITEKIGADFGVSYNLVPSDGVKFGDIGKLDQDSPYLGITFGINYKF